jgi:CBS domain-containing protein
MAEDIMVREVVHFSPETDVYDAIDQFVKHKISGAPVLGTDGSLVGILSEKDCMRLLIDGAYHGLPAGQVKDFMTQVRQTVNPKTDLLTIAGIFLNGSFRRLPVVENNKLVGLLSRHDVLKAIQRLKNQKSYT